MENEQYLDWNYYYAWGEFEYSAGKETKEIGSCSITSLLLMNQVNDYTNWCYQSYIGY